MVRDGVLNVKGPEFDASSPVECHYYVHVEEGSMETVTKSGLFN